MNSGPECIGGLINTRLFDSLAVKNCGDIIKEINEYHPKGFPPRPSELVLYDSLSKEKKRAEDGRGFWRLEFIEEYLDTKWEEENYNRVNFLRLHYLYSSAEPWPHGCGNDPVVKHAICKKLDIFKKKIESNTKPFPALRLDFKKYPFDEVSDAPQVDWED